MAVPKILVIPGSVRMGSNNARLAALAAKELVLAEAEVTRISLDDYTLPLFDGDFAADASLVCVLDDGAAIRRGTKGNAALAIAKAEPTFGMACERHGLRRIKLGEFHFGPVAALHRANAKGHISAEMGVGNFLDAMTAGDH